MKELILSELMDTNGGVKKPSDLDIFNPVKWYDVIKGAYEDCKEWGENAAGDFISGIASGYSKVFKFIF